VLKRESAKKPASDVMKKPAFIVMKKPAFIVMKKPASVVMKKPAIVMRKKCTGVVHQKGIHVDLMSCRIHQYNANTKAIQDTYDVVNFERVP
jgi:hypothetical protein